ncbi:hypothetical protein L916_04572 [Phytophthora nicotianae]|uniref:Uncharacterized protein n=1 Tax=Phytophthora nicotianae TaxID=4792 RepID=W2JI86_PHYNI|nr:hypothetical protein L916_04572 [Phytophthora nicotianae]
MSSKTYVYCGRFLVTLSHVVVRGDRPLAKQKTCGVVAILAPHCDVDCFNSSKQSAIPADNAQSSQS